jgi:hypothetical protein
MISFAHTTFSWATCCLICFIPIVICSCLTYFHYGSYRLLSLETGLTAGLTGRQGMLPSPWHLIPPLMYLDVRVRPFSDLLLIVACARFQLFFSIRLMRLITVRYFFSFYLYSQPFNILGKLLRDKNSFVRQHRVVFKESIMLVCRMPPTLFWQIY